jgi:hypothetical protein
MVSDLVRRNDPRHRADRPGPDARVAREPGAVIECGQERMILHESHCSRDRGPCQTCRCVSRCWLYRRPPRARTSVVTNRRHGIPVGGPVSTVAQIDVHLDDVARQSKHRRAIPLCLHRPAAPRPKLGTGSRSSSCRGRRTCLAWHLCSSGHNQQVSFALTARLLIPPLARRQQKR